MDQRVEAFLADVLALEGEAPDAIRQAVRASLADCEAVFRAQEPNRRMKEKAAQACHSLRRARVAEVLGDGRERRRRNTYTWSSASSMDQNSRREISLLGILSDADQHGRRSWLNAKSELPDAFAAMTTRRKRRCAAFSTNSAADIGKAEAARAIEPLCMLWSIPGFLRNDWFHAFKPVQP